MPDVDPFELLHRIQTGDELAEEELLATYTERLIALARSRLSRKVARRVDPEDVLQSVYRSFFRRARTGGYHLRHSDDMWRLLAAITIRKTLRQVRRHCAQKRTVAAEESADPRGAMQLDPSRIRSRHPQPEDAAVLAEETEMMMSRLSPHHRSILQLCLQGHAIAEIAERAECSERTVERAIKLARTHLEERLIDDNRQA